MALRTKLSLVRVVVDAPFTPAIRVLKAVESNVILMGYLVTTSNFL